MLLEASERLFMASATTETEPAAKPTMTLARQSARLQTMPTPPAMSPYETRTPGSFTRP